MDAVRDNSGEITDPVMKAEIQGFTTQEAIHSREHLRYNRMVTQRAGAVVTRLEEGVKNRIAFANKMLSPKRRLAVTVALEHFTAILADYLMKNPKTLEGADPEMARLWLWHAIEENEHKAVAFDVFKSVAPGLRGYLLRTRTMLLVTMTFSFFMFQHVALILKADGHSNFRNWMRLIALFWGLRGVITRTALPWFDFFRPGFHPWDHDNRALLETQRAVLQAA
ncbi:metal-dependent hydrolase [Oleomonas cavernae]|nr:metal-dependent hydrolase [Oleomonas cavernae]